jgi:hypothetical protein
MSGQSLPCIRHDLRSDPTSTLPHHIAGLTRAAAATLAALSGKLHLLALSAVMHWSGYAPLCLRLKSRLFEEVE